VAVVVCLLLSAHRAAIFAIAQLSCFSSLAVELGVENLIKEYRNTVSW